MFRKQFYRNFYQNSHFSPNYFFEIKKVFRIFFPSYDFSQFFRISEIDFLKRNFYRNFSVKIIFSCIFLKILKV